MGRPKVIRDPVHNIISLSSSGESGGLNAQLILDTVEFQRLRRIRQLGVSWFTYPGAEHSRFAHSLGVYHLAKRITDKLLQVAPQDVTDELRTLAPTIHAAALVHDIGHGPFSHVFEHVFQGDRHERWTTRILESPETEIHKSLTEQGIDVQAVIEIINETHGSRYAVDIVSSQLDADRMDYLLRDALMTGVEYGVYDIDWSINAMRIGTLGRDDPVHRLCVDGSKGMHAIEQYVLARLFMYLQVYLHKATRATEALLINIFRLAADIAGRGGLPSGTPTPVKALFTNRGKVDISTYLELDDFLLVSTLAAWSRIEDCRGDDELGELIRMCDTLVNRRRPYRCVELGEKDYSAGFRIMQHLDSIGSSLRYHCYLDTSQQTVYKGVLYYLGTKEVEDTLNLAMLVLDSDGECRPIERRSNLLRSLGSERLDVTRLFYDAEYEDEFTDLFNQFGITRQ